MNKLGGLGIVLIVMAIGVLALYISSIYPPMF